MTIREGVKVELMGPGPHLTIKDLLECHKNPDRFIIRSSDGKCYVDVCNLLMADPEAETKREAYRQEMISLCRHVKEMQKTKGVSRA